LAALGQDRENVKTRQPELKESPPPRIRKYHYQIKEAKKFDCIQEDLYD